MGTIVIAVAVAVTAIIVAPITWFAAVTHRKNAYESKIGSAEEKSREIIDEALKTAETKKREALLEAKEESIRTKKIWTRSPNHWNAEKVVWQLVKRA